MMLLIEKIQTKLVKDIVESYGSISQQSANNIRNIVNVCSKTILQWCKLLP